VEQTRLSGTGASAIYPLLACRLEPNWSFIGTGKLDGALPSSYEHTLPDIDERSVQFAKQNIAQNSLESRIVVERVQADGPILQPLHTSSMDFDFVMCNPPFYSSAEDILRSTEFKELGPNAVSNMTYAYVMEIDQSAQICSGAQVEMITPGGETHFVARIFSESLKLRTKCR